MRNDIAAQLNKITTVVILFTVCVTPLIFANLTTDIFETPKLIFLGTVVLALLLLSVLAWVINGKVTITRTPLDLPLFLLMGIVVLSAFFSPIRDISIFGNLTKIHGSAFTWITYILFYFLITLHLRSRGQVRLLYYALLLSVTISSLASLLAYFGAFKNIPFINYPHFTPTGSSFSTTALAALLLPFPVLAVLKRSLVLPTPFALLLAIIFALVITLTGTFATQFIAVLGVVVSIYIANRHTEKVASVNYGLLAIPVVLSVVVAVLMFTPSLGGKYNVIGQLNQNFPREIQLPLITSWKVSASAFRDSPFLGTGPSTYLYDFTLYKPVEHNNDKYWNVNFDSAFNEYLQVLASMGVLGLLALAFLSVLVLVYATKNLFKDEALLTKSLAISSILVVVLLALHASTAVMMIGSLVILAMLMALQKSASSAAKVEELTIGIKASKLTDSDLVTGDMLPLIVMIPVVIFVLYVIWNGLPLVRADYHHRLGLNYASNRGIDAYNNFITAVQLNPRADLYRTDLAQANFALANAIARAKGPTEASPGGSLTDEDKTNIQNLLSQSIQSGQAAIALNPLSSQNWEILASIYRQISGVAQNALQFSLDSYGRAIQRDPLNPILRLNVGGIYYSIQNYDLAIRFFTDAINLKPDYANAYYNLSIVLRDKGDLQGAVLTGERVVALLDPKGADYKTASDYLADLKARVATGSADKQQVSAPAAQTNSALQNRDLPNVLDLPKKDDIATPPAVSKNPKAPTTQSSPTPSASPANP